MQPVAKETGRSRPLEDGDAQSAEEGHASWFSVAQSHSDRAARAGFVVSMMFLAATAIYALHLSGATKAIFDELAAIADRAAYDAGFRLEDLAVSGSRNIPQATLLKALDLPSANSSLSYDAAEAQDRLLQLGWFESAEVRRVLPSRLEVVVSEREPFARWADAGNTIQLIDREGRVLGPDLEGRFGTLLLFAGDGATDDAAALLDALSGHEAIKQRIERAELVAERFWLIKLDNGVELKLPRKVNELVFGRLESLLANTKISEMALETIDLRLTNRTILQLREPTLANRDRAIASLTSQPLLPPRKGKAL